ncbi:NA- protein, partial [Sigmodon hispidus]
VGFRVGGETGSKYFVLQVHYGDISAFREFLTKVGYIPKRKWMTDIDVCTI